MSHLPWSSLRIIQAIHNVKKGGLLGFLDNQPWPVQYSANPIEPRNREKRLATYHLTQLPCSPQHKSSLTCVG